MAKARRAFLGRNGTHPDPRPVRRAAIIDELPVRAARTHLEEWQRHPFLQKGLQPLLPIYPVNVVWRRMLSGRRVEQLSLSIRFQTTKYYGQLPVFIGNAGNRLIAAPNSGPD